MSDWREGRGSTHPLNCNWHMNVFAMAAVILVKQVTARQCRSSLPLPLTLSQHFYKTLLALCRPEGLSVWLHCFRLLVQTKQCVLCGQPSHCPQLKLWPITMLALFLNSPSCMGCSVPDFCYRGSIIFKVTCGFTLPSIHSASSPIF